LVQGKVLSEPFVDQQRTRLCKSRSSSHKLYIFTYLACAVQHMGNKLCPGFSPVGEVCYDAASWEDVSSGSSWSNTPELTNFALLDIDGNKELDSYEVASKDVTAYLFQTWTSKVFETVFPGKETVSIEEVRSSLEKMGIEKTRDLKERKDDMKLQDFQAIYLQTLTEEGSPPSALKLMSQKVYEAFYASSPKGDFLYRGGYGFDEKYFDVVDITGDGRIQLGEFALMEDSISEFQDMVKTVWDKIIQGGKDQNMITEAEWKKVSPRKLHTKYQSLLATPLKYDQFEDEFFSTNPSVLDLVRLDGYVLEMVPTAAGKIRGFYPEKSYDALQNPLRKVLGRLYQYQWGEVGTYFATNDVIPMIQSELLTSNGPIDGYEIMVTVAKKMKGKKVINSTQKPFMRGAWKKLGLLAAAAPALTPVPNINCWDQIVVTCESGDSSFSPIYKINY